VAVLAAIPFLVLDGADASRAAMVVLAALPAIAGTLIARLNGRSWFSTLRTASVVLLVAALVVIVKTVLTHCPHSPHRQIGRTGVRAVSLVLPARPSTTKIRDRDTSKASLVPRSTTALHHRGRGRRVSDASAD
jgi:hypothetical protein